MIKFGVACASEVRYSYYYAMYASDEDSPSDAPLITVLLLPWPGQLFGGGP